jgi:hypothetical protein
MKLDDTHAEASRMIAGGMHQLTPRDLTERLAAIGYEIDPSATLNYHNTANEISYKAKSLGYTHTASRMRYAHVDAPRETLPALQEIRRNCFVFQHGRIWEL